MTPVSVLLAELDAILAPVQPAPPPLNIADITGGLSPDELAELAAEDHGGPLATIEGLVEGVLLRNSGCAATVAALLAISQCHLPRLLELHQVPPYAD